MREKHPLGRRLLALTAAVCTLGSLAVVPAANAEQAVPDKPVVQQTAPSDPSTPQAAPQAGNADGVQKPETGTDTQAGNADKPADTNTQQKPAAGNGDGGSADAAGQDDIPIDEANFPDAKFRGIVAKFDTDKDGKLSQAERDAVTDIDAAADVDKNPLWDLKSAKGVEYFPNLKTLDLSLTGITELDLSANLKLQTLNLNGCRFLIKLDITKNVNLKTLRLEETTLASLELPSGDDQLELTNETLGDDTAPQLLAVRGGTFKGGQYGPASYSGRAVVGDSLDLAAATGFSADELKGHILVLPEGFLKDGWKAGNPQSFDGTVLKPAKGLSYMSYLYFPRLGDREKWIKDPDFGLDSVPCMLVHLGFINPAIDQEEWKDVVEADSSEFTPQSWSSAEEVWKSSDLFYLPAKWGFDRSKQGTWDCMKFTLAYSTVGDNGGGVTAAYWESHVINGDERGSYLVLPRFFRSVLRVTPIAPTRGTDSADANVVTIPASARAVSYSVDDREYKPGDRIRIPVNGQIVVKAKVKNGWTLAENLDAKKQYWTFKWQAQTVASEKPSQNGDVLTVSPVTGVEYYYTYDESGKNLQPFDGQTSIRVGGRPVWVVAKPAKGYQFANNKTQVTYGPYSYTAPNPPDNGGDNGGSGDNGNNGGNGGTTTPSATIVDVERFYNPRSGEHFYTAGATEQSVLRASGVWRDEGVAFRMSSDKGTPVYRLYNPGGKHLFTTSERERDVLIKAKWNYEGVAFYVPDGAKTDVHRLYNPGNGDHLLTTSANERGVLVMHKWRDEGIAFKAE